VTFGELVEDNRGGHWYELDPGAVRGRLSARPDGRSRPAGRTKVCEIVQEVLKDEAFVAKHVGDDVPERKILYEDPKLGFCILAHVYAGKKESNPHDHGPSWRSTVRPR